MHIIEAALAENSRVLKKSLYTGCSKTRRCKACEIMRNEAYVTVHCSNPAIAGQMVFFNSLLAGRECYESICRFSGRA